MAIRFAFGPFRFFSSSALATGVASNVYSFKVCICQVALILQPDKHHGIYQKPPRDFTEKPPTWPKGRLSGKRGCACQLLFIPGVAQARGFLRGFSENSFASPDQSCS